MSFLTTRVKDFIECFSEAPSRREFFVEFSFDSQVRKDLKGPLDDFPDELIIIKNPSLSINVEYRHFLEYMKENLGENYCLHFDDRVRELFVLQFIKSSGKHYKYLIADFVRYTEVSDFDTFAESFDTLIEHLITNNSTANIEHSIHRIMRDYCRIQFAQRFRVNLLYKDYLNQEFEIGSTISDEFIQGTILKHERILNSQRVEQFLDSIETLVPLCGDPSLESEISEYRAKAKKEVPPPPEPLPSYIVQRRNNI